LSIWSNANSFSRVLVVQHLGDRSGQRRLAVVDVTDGADVDVRLGPLELRLGHFWVLLGLVGALVKAVCCSAVFLSSVVLLHKATGGYSPVALAMISFDTFAGTSAYESNSIE
jgi:hypothetical protein